MFTVEVTWKRKPIRIYRRRGPYYLDLPGTVRVPFSHSFTVAEAAEPVNVA